MRRVIVLIKRGIAFGEFMLCEYMLLLFTLSVRCFPHVINLAVGAFLDALPISAENYRMRRRASGQQPSSATEQYLVALESRPDVSCRETVVALRHGQRRRGLQQTIKEGNEKGFFKVTRRLQADDGHFLDETEEVSIKLDQLELIHDCRTRWSSTRNMIDRFVYLYPVSNYA